MDNNPEFIKGDQVAYIPIHSDGDINHPDVEFGFVTGSNLVSVFVRFWRSRDNDKLRTISNSESCNPNSLLHYASHTEEQVNIEMRRYGYYNDISSTCHIPKDTGG